MITQNAYNAFMAGAFGKTDLKNQMYNGSQVTVGTYAANGGIFPTIGQVMSTLATNTSSFGIHLGTNNETPTLADYYLKGTFLGASYAKTVKYTKVEDETGITHTSIITITNNTSEEISIGEVACLANIYTSNNGSTVSPCTVDRTTLDEPLVIPAGDTGQITYTIRIDFPG